MENQISQIPTQEVPSHPAKLHRSGIIPVLLVALATLSLATSYLFYQNQQLKKELINYLPTPTPNSAETPIPSSDPTANWKTYENLKYKFSFKYSDRLKISEPSQDKNLTIKITGLSQQISLTVDPISEHNFFQGKTTANTFTLNNIVWKYLTGDEQYCDGGECSKISDVLQTSNNNYRYTFILGSLSYPDETLSQILSTLRFIDATTSNFECAGPENINCSSGFACKLNTIGKPELGGICVNETETNP